MGGGLLGFRWPHVGTHLCDAKLWVCKKGSVSLPVSPLPCYFQIGMARPLVHNLQSIRNPNSSSSSSSIQFVVIFLSGASVRSRAKAEGRQTGTDDDRQAQTVTDRRPAGKAKAREKKKKREEVGASLSDLEPAASREVPDQTPGRRGAREMRIRLGSKSAWSRARGGSRPKLTYKVLEHSVGAAARPRPPRR